MTKAKNSPPRVETRKTEKTDGKKADGKSAAKTKKPDAKPEAEARPEKAAAKAEKTDKKATPAPAKESKAKQPAAKAPAREKKPAAEPAPAAPAKPDVSPAVEEAKPPLGFGNAGLGIKTASKKPGLSVPTGVMTLGRPAQPKNDAPLRPSERRLSKKEQGEIKTLLLEKRERLLAGMRRELAMQKERAESKAADEVDKATDAYDEDLSFEIATANDQELRDIQIALEKIENGTYGECEICGCAISPSRLKILPSATTCVACRGQEEQARRRDDGLSPFGMFGAEENEPDAEPL